MMADSLRHTPLGALSRPVAGTIGDVLVTTLPGSPKAVREILNTPFVKVVQHALELLRGGRGDATHLALGLPIRTPALANPMDAKSDMEVSPAPAHRLHSSNEPIMPPDQDTEAASVRVNTGHSCDCTHSTGEDLSFCVRPGAPGLILMQPGVLFDRGNPSTQWFLLMKHWRSFCKNVDP